MLTYLDSLVCVFAWMIIFAISIDKHQLKLDKAILGIIAIVLVYSFFFVIAKYRFSDFSHYFGFSTWSNFSVKNMLFFYLGTRVNIFTRSRVKSLYLILSIIYIISDLFISGKVFYDAFSMTAAYDLLMPALLFSYYLFFKKKKSCLIPLLLYVVLAIRLSRTPLLIFVAFCLVLIFIIDNTRYKRNFFISIAVSVILGGFFWFVFYDRIISSNIRTVSKLVSNSLFVSNTRVQLYSCVFDLIKNNMFAVNGVYTDRIILNNTYNLGLIYPHNIFLEFICQFGIVIGSIMSVVLIVMLCKYVFTKTDTVEGRLERYLLVFRCFIPLIVSLSYLDSIWFWALMGDMVFKLYLNIQNRKNIEDA